MTFRENALKLNARVKSIKLWHKDKRWKVVMGGGGTLPQPGLIRGTDSKRRLLGAFSLGYICTGYIKRLDSLN